MSASLLGDPASVAALAAEVERRDGHADAAAPLSQPPAAPNCAVTAPLMGVPLAW